MSNETVPGVAVVLAASSGDAMALTLYADAVRESELTRGRSNVPHQRAMAGATIIDRAELVGWLRTVGDLADNDEKQFWDAFTHWWEVMPPALRALLEP